MELDPAFLSRLQFAFVISFLIIFPAFTIGLAAWLATIEGARLATGNALYRRVFRGKSRDEYAGTPTSGTIVIGSCAVGQRRTERRSNAQ